MFAANLVLAFLTLAGTVGFAFDRSSCRIPEKFKDHPLFTAPVIGMNFGFGGHRGYYAANMDVPAKMKAAGVNWCVLKIHPCMEKFCSTMVFFDPVYTVGEQETADIVRRFHENGIHVMLQPSLASLDSTSMYWCCPFPYETDSQIEGRHPQYWKPWFESYREVLNVLAEFSERNGVEAFIAGCELHQTVKRPEEWRETLRQLRQRYSGPISYENGGPDTYEWLKDLDFVCLSYYPEAAPMPEGGFVSAEQWNALPDVSREQMSAYLRMHAVTPLDRLYEASGRLPVVLTEAGMTGAHGWCREPWNGMLPHEKGVRLDHREQADYIDAIFEIFCERPYCPGICLWKWDESQPRWFRNLENPSKDGGFTVQGKPAEGILRKWATKAAGGKSVRRDNQN